MLTRLTLALIPTKILTLAIVVLDVRFKSLKNAPPRSFSLAFLGLAMPTAIVQSDCWWWG